jgi:hypothetical protein
MMNLKRVAVLRGTIRGRQVDIEFPEVDGFVQSAVILDTKTRQRIALKLTSDESRELLELITAP